MFGLARVWLSFESSLLVVAAHRHSAQQRPPPRPPRRPSARPIAPLHLLASLTARLPPSPRHSSSFPRLLSFHIRPKSPQIIAKLTGTLQLSSLHANTSFGTLFAPSLVVFRPF
ncbi:hypothetical protein C8R47DRAFT_317892 [Mycena vitilis]|nr:hypothetical protein C8R47DRAFT_317892 [Mycena vitilis]